MEMAITGSKETLSVSDEVFACEYKEGLIHQVITAYMHNGRAGTKAQKTRSEVRGGGAKPWRQKGTGRARAGTIRSPLWRSGGVTFAAKPKQYSQKINRKMYRLAMRSMISELQRLERLVVVDNLKLEQPKTKDLLAKLKALDVDNALILLDEVDENIYLASRNIPNIEVSDIVGINPITLLGYDKILINAAGVKQLQEVLG